MQAVIQSEQFGTGIGKILRIQADEMRRKRRQRAQERGAQATLKMMLPMVGCIFPTLWIVLLGPAVLILMRPRYRAALIAFLPSIPAWELVLRAALIYGALLVALRLFGKREVGQFTLFDLVFILLVANALQPAITGPDTSLGGGLILIVTLVALNFLVGKLDNLPRFHR